MSIVFSLTLLWCSSESFEFDCDIVIEWLIHPIRSFHAILTLFLLPTLSFQSNHHTILVLHTHQKYVYKKTRKTSFEFALTIFLFLSFIFQIQYQQQQSQAFTIHWPNQDQPIESILLVTCFFLFLFLFPFHVFLSFIFYNRECRFFTGSDLNIMHGIRIYS